MTDELNEKQRAIVERIADAVSRKFIARPHEAEGEPRLPDIELTQAIVREEIGEWEKQRPRWWDIRRNLGTQLAGAGLAGIIALAVADYFMSNKNLVYDSVHWLAGTENRIDGRLASLFSQWGNGGQSDPAKVIDTAFKNRLNNWTEQKEFRNKSQQVLEGLARDRAPELEKLVIKALDSQPILMFQAQARLGSTLPVQVSNAGCEYLVSYWYEKRPEVLPEHLRSKPRTQTLEGQELLDEKTDELAKLGKACEVNGGMARDSSVNIPFWARFQPDSQGKKDQVFVLLYVKRSMRESEHIRASGFSERKRQSRPATARNTNSQPKHKHPYADSLNGLKIEYNPSKGDRVLGGKDVVDISGMHNRYGGFWHLRIDDLVTNNLKPIAPGQIQAHDLIHSLTVSLPTLPDDTRPGYCEEKANQPTANSPNPACLDEIVEVTAMVMVNKER